MRKEKLKNLSTEILKEKKRDFHSLSCRNAA